MNFLSSGQGGVTGEAKFTPEGEESWLPLEGSSLWRKIQPRSRFLADEMIDVGPPEKPPENWRRRDYWRLFCLGNGGILVAAYLFVALNPISLMFLAALLVMFNVGLFWMMFLVLKD